MLELLLAGSVAAILTFNSCLKVLSESCEISNSARDASPENPDVGNIYRVLQQFNIKLHGARNSDLEKSKEEQSKVWKGDPRRLQAHC